MVAASVLLAAEPKGGGPPVKPGAPAAKPPDMAKPPSEAAKPAAPEAAGPYKVKREPFKIEVTLKGMLEGEKTAEVAVRPELWATFEVVKAVEHGQAVRRGDVLVQFDVEKIDDELADLKTKRAIADLAFKQAEENLKGLVASTPMDLEASDRTQKYAHEDLAKYLKIDRPLLEKSANYMLKIAEDYLDNAQDELKQLEKMYKANDLTEETEKIVLKRQRRAVERAQFLVETSRANRDETLKIDLPRRQIAMEQGLKKLDIAAAKAKVSLPAALAQAQIEFEKLKSDRGREERRLKKLLADRELMTLKAPIDGVVYYGRFVRGRWSGAEMVSESLRPGGMVMKGAVVMTVVQTRPLVLRSSLGEVDVQKIRPGMKGTARCPALPDLKLPASISRVDTVPSAAESFEVHARVQADAKTEAVVPGMSCSVEVVAYSKDMAVVIPARAVMSDEKDEARKYVFLLQEGKPRERDVAVGKRSDDRVEIIAGLSEGDEILLERPKAPKPEEPKAPAPAAKEKKETGEKEAAPAKAAQQEKPAEKEKPSAEAGKTAKKEEAKPAAEKKPAEKKGKGKKGKQ
jgi:multidrug resistance efflux pump